ncbi:unnamed protein product, partial [Brachionus calyciflorus]
VITSASCLVDRIIFFINGEKYVHVVIPNQYNPTFVSMYKVYLYENKTQILNQKNQVNINDFYKHPDYDETIKLNDIGILKLNFSNFDFSLACLPPYASKVYPNADQKDAFLIRQTSNETLSVLENTNYKIFRFSECQNNSSNFDSNKQFCSGEVIKGCKTETGAVLFVEDIFNGLKKYVFVGLMANKEVCEPSYRAG